MLIAMILGAVRANALGGAIALLILDLTGLDLGRCTDGLSAVAIGVGLMWWVMGWSGW